MSTCNRLDLQTLGSRPVMPKNLLDHWCCSVLLTKFGLSNVSEDLSLGLKVCHSRLTFFSFQKAEYLPSWST